MNCTEYRWLQPQLPTGKHVLLQKTSMAYRLSPRQESMFLHRKNIAYCHELSIWKHNRYALKQGEKKWTWKKVAAAF